MDVTTLIETLKRLSDTHPIFANENDFRGHLMSLLEQDGYKCVLDFPVNRGGKKIKEDMRLSKEGESWILELKYCPSCLKENSFETREKSSSRRVQDFCDDIKRTQETLDIKPESENLAGGFGVFMTNEKKFLDNKKLKSICMLEDYSDSLKYFIRTIRPTDEYFHIEVLEQIMEELTAERPYFQSTDDFQESIAYKLRQHGLIADISKDENDGIGTCISVFRVAMGDVFINAQYHISALTPVSTSTDTHEDADYIHARVDTFIKEYQEMKNCVDSHWFFQAGYSLFLTDEKRLIDDARLCTLGKWKPYQTGSYNEKGLYYLLVEAKKQF